MPVYVFARLDPLPGKELQVHDELMRVLGPTRAEPGCLRIHVYATFLQPSAPPVYFIHSQWIDEAAFDAHVALPHTQNFARAVELLLKEPLKAVRTRQIG